MEHPLYWLWILYNAIAFVIVLTAGFLLALLGSNVLHLSLASGHVIVALLIATFGAAAGASMTSPAPALTPAKRRRLIAVALLRSLATAAVLVALYYLLPLDRLPSVPLAVLLAIGLVVLLAVASWQVRSIISAKHPTVRAIGALATTVPVFLLLFAATYYLMAKTSQASASSSNLDLVTGPGADD